MSDFLPSGILLINKPVGPTSHDIISRLRRLTGIKKIGHAGTLDPFASGLLICAVGREATKTIDQFGGLPKEYEAVFYLGATTDTYDRMGQITEREVKKQPTKEEISLVLGKFLGKIEQVPPMFSAKKVNGQKLYDLARAGKTIERQANSIEIFNLEILDYEWPRLSLRINCSKGTYIRSLAFDMGEALGVGAYVEELVRTKIGDFGLDKAINI
jgi:tRNA pseudouridine55 synthase